MSATPQPTSPHVRPRRAARRRPVPRGVPARVSVTRPHPGVMPGGMNVITGSRNGDVCARRTVPRALCHAGLGAPSMDEGPTVVCANRTDSNPAHVTVNVSRCQFSRPSSMRRSVAVPKAPNRSPASTDGAVHGLDPRALPANRVQAGPPSYGRPPSAVGRARLEDRPGLRLKDFGSPPSATSKTAAAPWNNSAPASPRFWCAPSHRSLKDRRALLPPAGRSIDVSEGPGGLFRSPARAVAYSRAPQRPLPVGLRGGRLRAVDAREVRPARVRSMPGWGDGRGHGARRPAGVREHVCGAPCRSGWRVSSPRFRRSAADRRRRSRLWSLVPCR